jgi:hypothetical protein
VGDLHLDGKIKGRSISSCLSAGNDLFKHVFLSGILSEPVSVS